MRPVIKDYLDALTAQPSERMAWREKDRHRFAIIEGYHATELTKEEREHFLNDDVYSLLSRHLIFDLRFKQHEQLAAKDSRLAIPPTEQERADHERILSDIEEMAYIITSEIYSQFGYMLNDETLGMGNRIILRDSGKQTFSDHVRQLVYRIKDEATPQPEPQPLQTLKTDKTREELQRIFTELQEAGFVSPESRLSDWLTAWGIMEDEAKNEDGASTPQQPEPFKRVIWTAKTGKVKKPNKKSLLDFLCIMGGDEDIDKACFNIMDIDWGEACGKRKADIIKDLFKVDGAEEFSNKDVDRYKRNKNKKRGYHDRLEEIVNRGK